MRKNIKKIGYIVLGIIVFLALTAIGINWWIDAKLPELISKKNDSPYHIQYKDLDVSLFTKTIHATGITVVPKETQKDSLSKNGIFGSVESLTIDNFSLFPLLFSDKIEAQTITIKRPKVTLFKNNDKTINSTNNIGSQVVAPF